MISQFDFFGAFSEHCPLFFNRNSDRLSVCMFFASPSCMLIFFMVSNVTHSICSGLFQIFFWRAFVLDGCFNKICKLYVIFFIIYVNFVVVED